MVQALSLRGWASGPLELSASTTVAPLCHAGFGPATYLGSVGRAFAHIIRAHSVPWLRGPRNRSES